MAVLQRHHAVDALQSSLFKYSVELLLFSVSGRLTHSGEIRDMGLWFAVAGELVARACIDSEINLDKTCFNY